MKADSRDSREMEKPSTRRAGSPQTPPKPGGTALRRSGPTRPKSLSAKRRKFVAEYLKHGNASRAARVAGYSLKTATAQGSRLLRKVDVARAVEHRLSRTELTSEDTLHAIRRQVNRDVRCLFDEAGNLRPIHELTLEEASMIAGLEVVIANAQAGDGHLDEIHKIKLQPQHPYVEMAAKFHGLIIDRSEVLHRQVDDRAPLAVLLERSKELIARIEARQAQGLLSKEVEPRGSTVALCLDHHRPRYR